MNEKDPARLVFEGKAGKAIVVSLIDMGGRLRLICQDIECVKPILPMPNLPVARVMWKALPSLTTGVECWITAGGAHHTVLSYDVTAEQMHDWANMMDIEFVHIGKDTTPEALEHDLFLADLAGSSGNRPDIFTVSSPIAKTARLHGMCGQAVFAVRVHEHGIGGRRHDQITLPAVQQRGGHPPRLAVVEIVRRQRPVGIDLRDIAALREAQEPFAARDLQSVPMAGHPRRGRVPPHTAAQTVPGRGSW